MFHVELVCDEDKHVSLVKDATPIYYTSGSVSVSNVAGNYDEIILEFFVLMSSRSTGSQVEALIH